MTHPVQALTEKEKETLRLLVNGYDAKSMARRLGLSVHTVNERLRDARRKMSVSSSREAARLLREAEGPAPQLLGDEPLRDAAAPIPVRKPDQPTASAGTSRRFAWLIGGIVMSLALALLVISSLSGGVESATLAPQSASAPAVSGEPAAAEPARRWLALVDAGKWDDSWNATGLSFKSLNTSAKWAEVSEAVRPPLGAALARELVEEQWVPAPPYGYKLVRFKTRFANKPEATETLTLIREDDSWKVTGYIID